MKPDDKTLCDWLDVSVVEGRAGGKDVVMLELTMAQHVGMKPMAVCYLTAGMTRDLIRALQVKEGEAVMIAKDTSKVRQ